MHGPSRPLASGVVVQTVSADEVYRVMAGAASQDPALLQASSARLKEMLDMFGTYDALHEIAAQRAVPLQIRQMSIIQFKNAALTHWRSRKVLSDEHRIQIRKRCFTFLDEEDATIAECNEVIVSKIARLDYPNNWPNLVDDLLAVIGTASQKQTLGLLRSLKLLNGIFKEFSNAKMLNSRTMGAMLAKCQVAFCGYYSTLLSSYQQYTYPDIISPRACTDILLAHMFYKCITKMALWLWNRLDKGGKEGIDVEASLHWSATALEHLVSVRQHIIEMHTPNGRSVDVLTRHIYLFGKFFRRLQELSSPRFAALDSCATLVAYYWKKVVEATERSDSIADSPEALYPVRFLVQGMVLFKDNIGQWKPLRKDGSQNQNTLPPEFVQRQTPSSRSGWADPEQWVNDQDTENEQWIFEIRPCSERVLMQLSNQFPDVVAPLLALAQTAGTLADVIQKEALYCAIGRCATKLNNMIPFDQWLQTTLVAEASSTDPHRRIAWLLGKLVSDSCLSPTNDLVWEVLIHLLCDYSSGSDSVTLDFDINVFARHLPKAVSELMGLLGKSDTLEIKRRVDYTLNVISDFINIITGPLPALWDAAGEDWLFKGSLLVTVTKLVEATKERSVSLTGIVVPLVAEGLSVATHLDEDTMDLWLASLRNTTSLQNPNGPALIDVFPLATKLLGENLDLLGKAINIIDAYFFLDGVLILQTSASDLFSAFRLALSSAAVSTNLKDMLISLNLLVQVTPSALWGEAMHTSGLFSLLMKNIVEGECGAILLTEHIYLMSRLVMADREMFFLRLMAATADNTISEAKLYDALLDRWWGTWDNMSEPRHRKLTAMGIAALVSTARPDVLDRLPGDIFNIWTDVLLELKEAQLAAAAALCPRPITIHSESILSPLNLQRHWELDEAPEAYYQNTQGTPEFERRKTVYDRDPVRTVQLTAYIATHLNEARTLCGPQAFEDKYLSKADPTVLAMIQDQLSRG
ncbi:armadillo-type protein [Mycena vulgaris]|nr:armadillo-type protein [Mycena vulgaris]